MSKHHIKSPSQVKEEFIRNGMSISGWARQHGFKRELVFSILSGKRACRIGKSHKIAVLLGIKDGEIV
jgi:gp16 family phage-associated protein